MRAQQSLTSTCVACSQPIRRGREDLVRNVCLRQAIDAWCVARALPVHVPAPGIADVPSRANAAGCARARTVAGTRGEVSELITQLQRSSPLPPIFDARARGVPLALLPPEGEAVEAWRRQLRDLTYAQPDGLALVPLGAVAHDNCFALASAGVLQQLVSLVEVYVHFIHLRVDARADLADDRPSAGGARAAAGGGGAHDGSGSNDRCSACARHARGACGARGLSEAPARALAMALMCVCDLAHVDACACAMLHLGIAVALVRLVHAPLPDVALTAAIACVPALARVAQSVRIVAASALPSILCVLAAGSTAGGSDAWRALACGRLPQPSAIVSRAACLALAQLGEHFVAEVRTPWTVADNALHVCLGARALRARRAGARGGETGAWSAGSHGGGSGAAAADSGGGSGDAADCGSCVADEPLACAARAVRAALRTPHACRQHGRQHDRPGSTETQAASRGDRGIGDGGQVAGGVHTDGHELEAAGVARHGPIDLADWLETLQLEPPDDPGSPVAVRAAPARKPFVAASLVAQLDSLRWHMHPDFYPDRDHTHAYRASLCTVGLAHWLGSIISCAAAAEVELRVAATYCLLDMCRELRDTAVPLVWPHVPLSALVALARGDAHPPGALDVPSEPTEAEPAATDDGAFPLHAQQLAAVRALWQVAFFDCAADALGAEPTRALIRRLAHTTNEPSGVDDVRAAEVREAAMALDETIAHTLRKRAIHADPSH
ncbi:hypothetical protein KFE25_000489 [Diacronema lutheri]|uniref:Uncharacterized protein n=1 Tax=Diacronema lutheri TaxID=2081491 RepID=A0A8J5XLR2_DIALT|nr:hypothetical protein KFE25_000489 [Diacronema lutheri]